MVDHQCLGVKRRTLLYITDLHDRLDLTVQLDAISNLSRPVMISMYQRSKLILYERRPK